MCRRMFVHKILPANPPVAFAGNRGMQQSAADAYGVGRQEAARLAPWKEEAGARSGRQLPRARGGRGRGTGGAGGGANRYRLVRIPPS